MWATVPECCLSLNRPKRLRQAVRLDKTRRGAPSVKPFLRSVELWRWGLLVNKGLVALERAFS